MPATLDPTRADPASCPAPTADTVCAHCGLPVPRGLIEPGADQQFCCNGCRTVHRLIRDNGLASFYNLRDHAAASVKPAQVTGRRYDEFADPKFVDLYCRDAPNGLKTVDFVLEGVHCAACLWLIERLPRIAAGVIEARLALGASTARITWDPAAVTLPQIARTLDSLGYPPHPLRDRAGQDVRTREDRRYMILTAIAGACAGNAMLLAFALYAGMFGGIEEEFRQLFRWVSVFIGVVSLAVPGRVFFRGAWAAIRARTPNLDLPIALALGAGGVAGVVNVAVGRGEIYFDSLTVLVFLLLIGRWVQHRQQRRAADAVELLFSLTPSCARRVEPDGQVRETPIEAIEEGDVVEVRPGDAAPADGRVVEGASCVRQSLLTGESRPVEVGPGEPLFAGTINLQSVLRVRVSRTGRDTRVGRLMQLVEQGARDKAPIVRLTDRIGGWFVMTVIAFATVTFAAWATRGVGLAVDHAVALLIVACPCALGMTTPLAMAIAIGRAARRDILIKGGDVLERLARPGVIVLDKTGTITAGRTRLVHWFGDASLQTTVAAVERGCSHHIARACVEAFEDAWNHDPVEADAVAAHPEGGVSATVGGRRIKIGSPRWVEASEGAAPWLDDARKVCDDESLTLVLVAVDGAVQAGMAFGDAIRDDAADAVARLRRDGWEVTVLSGDDPALTAAAAARVGIDPAQSRGAQTPEDKLGRINAMTRDGGHVVMVGDGVNDAAALAAASVGIAVHGGAEASLAAADVYLDQPGLMPIVDLVETARRAMRLIRRNLAVSLAYNALAVGLAAAGLITPLAAAILMPLSSFTLLAMTLGAPSPETRHVDPLHRPAPGRGARGHRG